MGGIDKEKQLEKWRRGLIVEKMDFLKRPPSSD